MGYDFWIQSCQDLINAVQEYGIVPYFSNSIPGFSLEEHCNASVLFSETGEEDTWAWKGPVIQSTGCAYAKLFEKKSTYVRSDLFCDLANYRRDGYDFDARYDDGLAKYQDKQLFDLINKKAVMLTMAVGRKQRGREDLTLLFFGCRSSVMLLPVILCIQSIKTGTNVDGVSPNTVPRKNSLAAVLRRMSTAEQRKNPMSD